MSANWNAKASAGPKRMIGIASHHASDGKATVVTVAAGEIDQLNILPKDRAVADRYYALL